MREADEKKFTVFLFRFKETKNDFQKICMLYIEINGWPRVA